MTLEVTTPEPTQSLLKSHILGEKLYVSHMESHMLNNNTKCTRLLETMQDIRGYYRSLIGKNKPTLTMENCVSAIASNIPGIFKNCRLFAISGKITLNYC